MKVLLVSVWKPRRGGIVTHVENLIRRSKNRFTILTYRDSAAGDEPNVLRVPYLNVPLLRGVSFALFSFFRGLKADYDIIHAHYAIPQGFAGVLLKRVRGRPLVLTIHGSDLTVLGSSPFVRPILKWVLRNCDRIIAVSAYMKGLVIGLGVPEERVRVIHNGVDTHSPAEEGEARLLFIGALVKQKGADILIWAFEEIKKKLPELKLVLVGDGPDREMLEGLVSRLGARDVEFKGYVEDIDGVFTSQSVLVVPSRQEGFGIVALEAMARGVPVVASKTGGLEEIILNRENGLLFEKEDMLSLASAVIEIFENPEIREGLIKNGLKTAQSYSWDQAVKEIDDVYMEVAG